MKSKTLLHALLILTLSTTFACSKKDNQTEFSLPDGTQQQVDIHLADSTFSSGKKLSLSTGIGSGAYRFQADPSGVIYTISDRGPNIKCSDDKKLIGADICKKGKIFPVPEFAPTIYKYKITKESAELLEMITLKDSSGKDITGLPNPFLKTNTEQAFDVNGNPIEFDPSGVDTESLIKLSDGTYWLSEEYGPSIMHVAADGKVIKRLVPAGLEEDLKGAKYPVVGTLPEILMKRKLNRGIESISVDPSENNLYFILQSPLANPDSKAYKKSAYVRIFKMDLASEKITNEYIYQMEDPATFIKDNLKKNRKQNDVKISEMVGLAEDKLLVLERISASTKLFVIDLSNADSILNTVWDDIKKKETFEQLTHTDFKPVSKKLVFDTDNEENLPNKIEGIALMKNGKAVLVNDNDFGIAGDKTTFTTVSIPLQ